MTRRIRVQSTPREVIGKKLLTALDDTDKVGICLTQSDLAELLIALSAIRYPTAKAKQWISDLRTLQKAAFGLPDPDDE